MTVSVAPSNSDLPSIAPERLSQPALAEVSGPSHEAKHNPLPAGMRDLLPPKALRQSRVGGRVMKAFELHGYGRVWLPLFEYTRVLERTANVNGSALRFVEPESGEVVALRSDMTPQIARLVSTRYAQAPLPVRLCYQGSVLRRRHERARTESQVVQAGVELVGVHGRAGDTEVLEVMGDAVKSTGLRHVVLDLGHAGIAQALMRSVPRDSQRALADALSAKDPVEIERQAQACGVLSEERKALVAIADLHGGAEIWTEAFRVLASTAARAALQELKDLYDVVMTSALFPEVVVDLGEVRGVNYYTGPMFQLLAHGPGEPIASGGRYDTLLPRFGLSNTPAAGFGIDLNNLCWALETEGVPDGGFVRVACGETVSAEFVKALRARGVVVGTTLGDVAAFAVAYDYHCSVAGNELRRLENATSVVLRGSAAERVEQTLKFIADEGVGQAKK
jgi:ATP phosphoribosyltransferase regulatory subunit